MKFAVVGDVHISDVAPSTRKDDYRNVVLGKLRFIIDQVNQAGDYQAVLFLGDLFHKKVPFHNSHSMISALIRLFETCSCPIYIIPGNHDIHGNMSTFENQPLNVLIQAGVVRMLTNQDPVLFNWGGVSVSLNGTPFSPLLDSKDSATLYNLNHLDVADVKISMFHQMVLPDDKKFFADYINFADLAGVNCDVLLCGHYHEGYNPSCVYENGKFFVNPGSITRGTAEQANFDKTPKFTVLSIDKVNGTCQVQATDIEIPHVVSDEVFDFTVIERNQKKKDMHKFMDGLSEMESQSLSTQEPSGVINALKVLGFDARLEPLALKYLDDAYATLS